MLLSAPALTKVYYLCLVSSRFHSMQDPRSTCAQEEPHNLQLLVTENDLDELRRGIGPGYRLEDFTQFQIQALGQLYESVSHSTVALPLRRHLDLGNRLDNRRPLNQFIPVRAVQEEEARREARRRPHVEQETETRRRPYLGSNSNQPNRTAPASGEAGRSNQGPGQTDPATEGQGSLP